MVSRQLEQKDIQISSLLGSLNTALEKIKETHKIINNQNTGPTLIQEKGLQAGNMIGNNIKEINFDDATHMAELVKQLQDLIETLPTRSDATAQPGVCGVVAPTAEQRVKPEVSRCGTLIVIAVNRINLGAEAALFRLRRVRNHITHAAQVTGFDSLP
jgi:hypothetical protein